MIWARPLPPLQPPMDRKKARPMPDERFADLERQWLERVKQAMALDLARGMTAGLPPKALVECLFKIPEVEQAFAMRAKGRRKGDDSRGS
jgi:hypothetical protein